MDASAAVIGRDGSGARAGDTEAEQMIPDETLHLRDSIIAAALARGVPLEEHTLRREVGLPVLRLRLGGKIFRGCWIGLPGDRGRYQVDVVTVHGSGHRASKMWPRRVDGGFDVEAITGHVLALVELELSRQVPEMFVPSGIAAAASGLHVVYLAALRLGTVSPDLAPLALVRGIADEKRRNRIKAHLHHGGLTDGDMRAVAEAAGLFLWRPNKLDFDPFEPADDRTLSVLQVGKAAGARVERRYVLILDNQGTEIDLADPAGDGLTVTTPPELTSAWKLGARRGRSWTATVSARG
jgi:hypothetical protein